MSAADTNPLQIPEALFRTRTGDPFLTIVGAASKPVPSGHNESPDGCLQGGTEDPSGPPKRPQDAPTRALCPSCDGTGEDHSRRDGACTACDGWGNGQECPKCGGWMPPWRFADECQACAWDRAGAA